MKSYLIIACLLLSLTTVAQEHEVNYTGQLWSEIDLSGKISKKLKWQVDLQYSRQGQYDDYDLFRFNSQFTFRPWLHYYPVKNLRISAFAGLWYNFAISEAGAREYPEYRGALQATWYRPKMGRLLSYRFRSEFRDIEDRQGLLSTLPGSGTWSNIYTPFIMPLSISMRYTQLASTNFL